MTTNILPNEVHKVSSDDDLEKILRSLVDENGICKTCGCDHSIGGKEQSLETIHK